MAGTSLRRNGATALGLALGVAAGRIGYPAASLTRMMFAGLRQPLWGRPEALGMAAEDVVFGASDGVILREGFLLSEGVILRETNGDAAAGSDPSLLGD